MYEYERREKGQKHCDYAGCSGAGEHRAPKSPDVLDDYYWFCLEHVREYNKQWSYNAEKTAEEIEAEIRDDILGNRPTWSVNDRMAGAKIHGGDYQDPLNIFGTAGLGGAGFDGAENHADTILDGDMRHAYAVLGLEASADMETIKTTYKKKAKQYHPDLNKNDSKAEETFKQINNAYKVIMDGLK